MLSEKRLDHENVPRDGLERRPFLELIPKPVLK
jgi:hypothetical protein